MSLLNNIILNTDSYKTSMFKQYPPDTRFVYSYIEARSGSVFDKTVFFGLQAYIKEYVDEPITRKDIDTAEKILTSHGAPFNKEGWEYILEKYNGKLPVRIASLPEGTVVPKGTPMVVIVNTDPKCFWLTTYLESSLLRAVWYPSSVATIAHEIAEELKPRMEMTCDTGIEFLPFKLNDFGLRGVASAEAAMLGGMGHLIPFMGTDNLNAIVGGYEFYNADEAIGYTINAAMEHSTVTSWRDKNGVLQEREAFSNMLKHFAKPGTIVAAVSDSEDLENAVNNIWGKELKQQVMDSGATVVVRPDSGDPTEVVMKTLLGLANAYGTTTNDKGYKVLNTVRVIQGDGINKESIISISDAVINAGFSMDNIVFGMGGALLQHVDRDWGCWAMKCSSIQIGEQDKDGTAWQDVYKAPKTDPSKKSKAGQFYIDKKFKVRTDQGGHFDYGNELRTKYCVGEIAFPEWNGLVESKELTFDDVRANYQHSNEKGSIQ